MASTGCKGVATRLRRWAVDEQGQASVEFAVVLFAFLAVAAGLAALWRMQGDGALVRHALTSASHHIAGAVGAWGDVLAY